MTKKQILPLLILLSSTFFLFAADPLAQAEIIPEEENSIPIVIGGSVEFESKYIWNGINMAGGAVFQTSVFAAWNDFSVFVWANMPMNDKQTAFGADALKGQFDEVDLGVAYGHAFEHIVLDLSFTYFVFPQAPKKEVMTSDSTTTLIPSLSYEAAMALSTNFNIVNFSLPMYFGLSHGSLYLGPTLSAGYTFEGIMRPDLSAKLGIAGNNYNDANFGVGVVGEGSLSDFTTTFTLTSDMGGKIGEILTIRGWVGYAALLNDKAKASVTQDSQNFWGGINLSVGF